MAAPEGLTAELKIAWDSARSAPTDKTPPGTYIGAVKIVHTTFYFYKDGVNYWFEDTYTRQKREEKELKRKQERQRQYNSSYGGYYGRR